MMRVVTPPLAPFVDRLPVPSRLLAAEHDGRLAVSIRAGAHRFHRDLPASRIWGYEGTVPGPTIEAERNQPVTVEWRNELAEPLPVVGVELVEQGIHRTPGYGGEGINDDTPPRRWRAVERRLQACSHPSC